MSWDRRRFFYDDLVALQPHRARSALYQAQLAFSSAVGSDATLTLDARNSLAYTPLVDVVLTAKLPSSDVFIFDGTTAQAILEAKIDSPTLEEFRKMPFRSMFLNFKTSILIPELMGPDISVSLPAQARVYALQVVWVAAEEYLGLVKDTGIRSLHCGASEFFYAAAWYDGLTEPGGKQVDAVLSRELRLPPESLRWQTLWYGGGVGRLDLNSQPLIQAVYKFMAYLTSSNVVYVKEQRIAGVERNHRGIVRRTLYHHPVYRSFIKDRTVRVREESSGVSGRTIQMRHRVIGHHSKYYHCPRCKRITPVLSLMETGLCKWCKSNVGLDPALWESERRWIPPHERGPEITDQVLHSTQEKYLVKDAAHTG